MEPRSLHERQRLISRRGSPRALIREQQHPRACPRASSALPQDPEGGVGGQNRSLLLQAGPRSIPQIFRPGSSWSRGSERELRQQGWSGNPRTRAETELLSLCGGGPGGTEASLRERAEPSRWTDHRTGLLPGTPSTSCRRRPKFEWCTGDRGASSRVDGGARG